jgi:hypothetical protein
MNGRARRQQTRLDLAHCPVSAVSTPDPNRGLSYDDGLHPHDSIRDFYVSGQNGVHSIADTRAQKITVFTLMSSGIFGATAAYAAVVTGLGRSILGRVTARHRITRSECGRQDRASC